MAHDSDRIETLDCVPLDNLSREIADAFKVPDKKVRLSFLRKDGGYGRVCCRRVREMMNVEFVDVIASLLASDDLQRRVLVATLVAEEEEEEEEEEGEQELLGWGAWKRRRVAGHRQRGAARAACDALQNHM